jgi:hypothetical protein
MPGAGGEGKRTSFEEHGTYPCRRFACGNVWQIAVTGVDSNFTRHLHDRPFVFSQTLFFRDHVTARRQRNGQETVLHDTAGNWNVESSDESGEDALHTWQFVTTIA